MWGLTEVSFLWHLFESSINFRPEGEQIGSHIREAMIYFPNLDVGILTDDIRNTYNRTLQWRKAAPTTRLAIHY
jgi:hypothetical protein